MSLDVYDASVDYDNSPVHGDFDGVRRQDKTISAWESRSDVLCPNGTGPTSHTDRATDLVAGTAI